jgi:hypothetical protein
MKTLTQNGIPKALTQKAPNRTLFLFLLCNAGLTLGTLLLVGLNILFTLGSQDKGSYAYVQMDDGRVEKAKAVAPHHRDAQVVKQFVKDWFVLGFNWLPPQGEVDEGVPLYGKTYPSSLALAASQVDPIIRQGYLDRLHSVFGLNKYVGKTNHSCVVLLRHVGEPEEIQNGEWKISVISTLLFHEGGKVTSTADYNLTLKVMAIEPHEVPFAESAPELLQFNYEMLQQGLLITEIEEFV